VQIPHSRPKFGLAFEQAATQVLKSGILAQGDETTGLEQDIGQALNQQHVLAVDSGTSALTLAIRQLTQHKTNARIGIPSFACASILFAVKAAGAMPVFMDCNAQLTLDAEQAKDISKTLDVLVLVHPFGMVEPLVTESFPCPVIEDIAQSVGATINQQPIGSFADICIGSLYATKPWGGAYGGFICGSEFHIQHIKTMCDPDQANLKLTYAGHHQLSNIHAALASQRLSIAKKEQQQRAYWAIKYDAVMQNYAVTPVHQQNKYHGNHFRYIIHCQQDAETLIHQFQAQSIDAKRPIQQPLHHADPSIICRHANHAFHHCLSLPLLADMDEEEFHFMQQGIQHCLAS